MNKNVFTSATFSFEDFSVRTTNSYKDPKIALAQDEIQKISTYLDNPTQNGLWTLTIIWDTNGGIHKDLNIQLTDFFAKQTSTLSLRQLKTDLNKKSFIFSLFCMMVCNENTDKDLEGYINDYSGYREVLHQLNINGLKKKYNDAYTYFQDNIYFKGIIPTIWSDKLLRIKEGTYVLEGDQSNEKNNLDTDEEESINIKFIALDKKVLEKIETFFDKLGKMKNSTINRTFSPEEDVFSPYLSFLESSFPRIIHSPNYRKKMHRTISEYHDKEYEYCISTVGVISEELITEVYETYFRTICPKGLGLGEIYQLIQSKVLDKIKKDKLVKPDVTLLYKAVKSFEEEAKIIKKDSLVKLIREIVKFLQENDKYTNVVIQDSIITNYTSSIFPRYIKDNLSELIKNRNAASHKTPIPLGSYEALRSIYCFITIMNWWNKEKSLINWELTDTEIIAASVEKASLNTI